MMNSEIAVNKFRSPQEKNDPLNSWGFLLNVKKSLVNADVLGIKSISTCTVY